MCLPRILAAAAAIALLGGGAAQAEVRLAGVFADHMVLQRELPVAVWGRAEPGEGVTVEFKGQRKATTAGADGRWQVTLDPLKADASPASLTVSSSKGGQPLVRKDVLVGEVWLIAGQSNAGMALKECLNPEQEIAAANDPLLRHMTNTHVFDGRSPRPDAECTWQPASPQVAGDFNAVPYFFGRSLRRKLDVPVGVIAVAYGGSRIEAWMTPETLATTAWGRETIDVWRGLAERNAKSLELSDCPAAILNGKVAPLAPFACRGAVWYQGENNAADKSFSHYRTLLPLLIADWRRLWQRDDMAFLVVQLPPYVGKHPDSWAVIRDAIRETTDRVAKTRMAVTIDLIEPVPDIHPREKAPIGERLALQAMNLVYGDSKTVASGPLYRRATFAEGKATLEFDHVGGGLEAKGGPLREFTIAGADRKFVPAEATIQGDRVVVHSPAVAEPVAVRYGWANDPRCNLFNRDGLPASPFRTDAWELTATYPHYGCYRASRHTEMRILPRKKPVVIDGDLGDWDLSSAIFMHMHQFNRDTHNCRAALMYDDANLYLACHIKDPTPMRNNHTLAEAGMGWNADAVQVYLYGDPDKRSEIATWRDSPEKKDPAEQNKIAQLTLWYSTAEKKPGFQVTYGLDSLDAKVNPEGVEAAFKADADGAGYVLEYKIPLALLHVPRALVPGDRIQTQFQVQWGRDDGRSWKLSVTDLTNPKGFNPTSEWDRAYHGPIGSGTAICE